MTAKDLRSSKLKCSQCPKKFKYESEKRRHELSHSPQFPCSICSKKFSFVSALRRHEKQHDRTGSASCTECGKKFRDDTLLKRHMNYAHKGTYNCRKCSSIFKSEMALQMHMKTHRPVSERQFQCSFDNCSKTFNFVHHLKHHELTHTNKKQHFCNVCGKGFIQLHHLKTHVKTHNHENWITCKVSSCKKKFSTEYAIKRHLATHENILGDQFIYKSKSVHHLSVKLKTKVKDAVEDELENTNVSNNNNTIEKDSKSLVDSKYLKQQSIVNNQPPINIVTDCTTVLGSCLMNSDSIGDDCLCAQMTHNEDEPYDLTPIGKKKYISLSDIKSDTKLRDCKDCECASICNVNNTCNISFCKPTEDVEHPNIEYGVDGIVKLKDTFDIDVPENVVIDKDKDSSEDKSKTVPYNSCKAILGKCIVSGSGTISENCLCAKMHFDELQVLSEEVEDIIPHPNDPQLDTFVI